MWGHGTKVVEWADPKRDRNVDRTFSHVPLRDISTWRADLSRGRRVENRLWGFARVCIFVPALLEPEGIKSNAAKPVRLQG